MHGAAVTTSTRGRASLHHGGRSHAIQSHVTTPCHNVRV
jgi:hypothetical protein